MSAAILGRMPRKGAFAGLTARKHRPCRLDGTARPVCDQPGLRGAHAPDSAGMRRS